MSNISSTSKNHSKKLSGRDRDKNKSLPSESGGSSQCETPPLGDKDASTSHGKFAGVSAESVVCMAEQIGAEISVEAASNLAEDVSYKLRQTISTIALHSEMTKKSRVDYHDVNTTLILGDTSPIVGTHSGSYITFGEEKLCCQHEYILNITEYATTPQSYTYSTLPTVSVEWITDEKNLNSTGNISASLQNYYTKVARAILNLKRKPKEVAVEDLTTNTRIGPIFPNLFNLAVLVLNDDNLIALNVPAKKPLQSNVLDMVDALCSNPCSLDTNIQQQFQRLFPVMVSNILGNGSLAEEMVAILTKITRTWPSFIAIGKGILFEYLSQGIKERLTAPMIKCVMALGRQALVECLGDHLDHLDNMMHSVSYNRVQLDLRETLIDVSTCLLRSEPTTYLEDFVTTDYTLYEMLGDSIMPRRLLFPVQDKNQQRLSTERTLEDDVYSMRPAIRSPKFRLVAIGPRMRNGIIKELVFECTRLKNDAAIRIKIKNCRSMEVSRRTREWTRYNCSALVRSSCVVVASGLLNRFTYRLNKKSSMPIFGAMTL